MRRIRRNRHFDLSLVINDDRFIRPPRDSQRNWLINRAVSEFCADLQALDRLAGRFVPGAGALHIDDRTQAVLDDQEIMEDWQIPLMRAMTRTVSRSQGDILEIGFGRGIASTLIQECGVKSHTIIECNDSIVENLDAWRRRHTDRDIRIVHGLWQDTIGDLGRFDGIFFHTYPLNEDDFVEQIASSTTFAEHFFDCAADHLVDGGIFTYLSNEIDSLSRAHQRGLLSHFRALELEVVRDLPVSEDVRDAWWSDSMVVVSAVR